MLVLDDAILFSITRINQSHHTVKIAVNENYTTTPGQLAALDLDLGFDPSQIRIDPTTLTYPSGFNGLAGEIDAVDGIWVLGGFALPSIELSGEAIFEFEIEVVSDTDTIDLSASHVGIDGVSFPEFSRQIDVQTTAPAIDTTTNLTIDEDASSNIIEITTEGFVSEELVLDYGDPQNGTVAINDDGSFVYSPNPNFNGSDEFTITASDSKSSVTETITISVSAVDDAPTNVSLTLSGGSGPFAVVGDTLTAGWNIVDVDGIEDGNVAVTWLKDGDTLATGLNYHVLEGDVGSHIGFRLSYTDNDNTSYSFEPTPSYVESTETGYFTSIVSPLEDWQFFAGDSFNNATYGEDYSVHAGRDGLDYFEARGNGAIQAFLGGKGKDHIRVAHNNVLAIIVETDDQSSNVLELTNVGFNQSSTFLFTIDEGKHLFVGDNSSKQYVILLDWQNSAYANSYVILADGTYSHEEITDLYSTRPNYLGDKSWEETSDYYSANTSQQFISDPATVSQHLLNFNDTLEAELSLNLQLSGSDVDDILEGGDGNDIVNAGDGNDIIKASDGIDTINAGGGDDRIYTKIGVDQIDGGAGIDTLIFEGIFSERPVIDLNLGATYLTGASTTPESKITNVENVEIASSSSFKIIGNDADNSVISGSGDDVISSGGGNDYIIAGAGNDHVFYSGGADFIDLGTGSYNVLELRSDAYFSSYHLAQNVTGNAQVGTYQRVRLDGKLKVETVIKGEVNSDVWNGGPVNEIVLVSEDAGFGFFLHDAISEFNSGIDLEIDSLGNMSAARFNGLSDISGSEGNDVLDMTSPDYSLSDHSLLISGGDGDDIIWGSDADEEIKGDAGNDVLFGGIGSNLLNGGGGADEFQFTMTSESDTIQDFSLSDGDTLKFFNSSGAAFDRSTIELNGSKLSIHYSDTQSITITMENTDFTLEDLSASIFIV